MVLAPGSGGVQAGAEQPHRAHVGAGRQVGDAAPGQRVVESQDGAQAPDGGTLGHGRLVVAVDGDGTAGQAPQGGGVPEVRECLYEGDGGGGGPRERGVCGVRAGVQRQQGHDAVGRLARQRGANALGEAGPVCVVGHLDGDEPGAVGAQSVEDGARQARVGTGVVRGWCGHDGEPGAGRGGVGGGRDRLPGHAVAPGVDGGGVEAGTAPRGERGHHVPQRCGVGPDQPGQRVRVAGLHLVPERRVRCGVRRGRRGAVGVRGLRPVATALEGVGGQVGRFGLGVQVGPALGHAPHMELAERGEHPGQPAFVPAQGAHDNGVRRGRRLRAVRDRVQGFLHAHGQYGMGADLDVRGVPLRGQPVHRGGELDGVAQVGVPVGGVELSVGHELAGHGGQHGDRAPAGCQRGQVAQQLLLDPGDLRGVRGVVHGYPAGPHLLGAEFVEQRVERVRVPGDGRGAGSVDGGDGQLVRPPGEACAQFGGGQRHRGHAAGSGEPAGDGPAAQGDHACAVLE